MRVLLFILEISKPYRNYLWGMLFAICIISVDANFKPYFIKYLIDRVTKTEFESVWKLVIVYGLFQLQMQVARTGIDWLGFKYNACFRVHVARVFTSKISKHSYDFFQVHPVGNIVSKISDAFHSVHSMVVTTIYYFIHFALTTFITLILLTKIHPLFALGLLTWICVFLLITTLAIRKVIPLAQDYAEARAKIWGYLSDYLNNILSVKLFTSTFFENKCFSKVSDNFVFKYRKKSRFMLGFYLIQGLILSMYALCFLSGLIYLRKRGIITPGDIALIFMLNFRAFDKLYEISHVLREFVVQWGAVEQALSILDKVENIEDQPGAKNLVVTRGEIVFDKVQFHYRGAEPLFHNKSVIINPGQKVGLVGYSGGGKTTFVSLILRLYEIHSGRILIDGQDIQEITQDSLRAAIGVIPQDPGLFHRSLLENIRYGRQDATDEEVLIASKYAHAHEFISQLPQGYYTLVGERGVKLSGGQRQRIAIARAFLKNAPILILDEATSQLDSLTEQYIQESLWKLMGNKTTLIIAHRLSTLLNMDRILVFKEGKIVEDGSHQELLEKGKLYKQLWNSQVGGFLGDDIYNLRSEASSQ